MKKLRVALYLSAILMILGFFGFKEMNRRSGINATLAWAGLNELPKEIKVESFETKGSMFSREFILTVSGSADVIESWLKASPGTRAVLEGLEKEKNPIRLELEPSEGASFAEIIIKDEMSLVVIRAYWS